MRIIFNPCSFRTPSFGISNYVTWVSIWRGSDTRNAYIFPDLSTARWRIVYINFRFSHKRILDGCARDVQFSSSTGDPMHRRGVYFMGPARCPRSCAIISGNSDIFFFFTSTSRRYHAIYETLIVWQYERKNGQKGARGLRTRIRSTRASLFAPHPPICTMRATYRRARACSCIRMYEHVGA